MSIMELGALGEFFGVFALVATLIYLSMQVRKSKRAMEENSLLVRQAALDRAFDHYSRHRNWIINDAEVARIWIDGAAGAQLNEVDARRFNSLATDMILLNRQAYLRSQIVKDDILKKTSTEIFARGLNRNTGMRRVWEGSMSHEWVPEWAEEVERIRTQLEAAEAQQ